MPSPNAVSDQQLLAAANQHSRAQPQGSSSPAGPTDQQLLAAAANGNPAMSTAEDWGRSAVTGLERGITSLVALPRTVNDFGTATGDWLGDRSREFFGQPPLTPQQRARVHAISDQMTTGDPLSHWVPQSTLDTTVQKVAGPYHTPQSAGGRLIETAGEMAPAALLPIGDVGVAGNLAMRGARVAVPALTSWGAGEVAPEPYKNVARFGGALIGGFGEGAAESAATAPQRILAQSATSLTPEQAAQVAALRAAAANRGISITVPEAVQQVTNGATGMGRVQRLVENARATAPKMQGYFADRPDQVRNAVTSFANDLAPDANPFPSMLGLDAQRAATGAQMQANSARSAATGPIYRSADLDQVPADDVSSMLANVDQQIAGDRTGLLAPLLQRFKASLTSGDNAAPITDIGNLSRARNYWRDQMDIPPVGQDALTKEQAGVIGGHLDTLDAMLKANPQRSLADAMYAAISRNQVDPLNAGPIGRIAQTPEIGAQTSALYPANPPLGQPDETAAALSELNGQGEGLANALTRQHIVNALNQSTRDLTSGPNQYGGALFARNIQGNAEQANTLNAGLDVIDPTGSARQGWQQLTDALMATGRRERPGSMTAFNESDLNALKLPPAALRVFGGVGDPLEWTKNIANWSGNRLYGRNLDQLANMMLDPDTDAVLQRMAAARQQTGGALFGSPAALQSQQPSP